MQRSRRIAATVDGTSVEPTTDHAVPPAGSTAGPVASAAPLAPPAAGCAEPAATLFAANALFHGGVSGLAADASALFVVADAYEGPSTVHRIYAFPRAGGPPKLLRTASYAFSGLARVAAGKVFVARAADEPNTTGPWGPAAMEVIDSGGVAVAVPLGIDGIDLVDLEDFVVTPDESVYFSINHHPRAGLYRANAAGATLLLAGAGNAFGWLALGADKVFAQDNLTQGHVHGVPMNGGPTTTLGPTFDFGVASDAARRVFAFEPRNEGTFVAARDQVTGNVLWELANGWFGPLEVDSDGVFVYWRDYQYTDPTTSTLAKGSAHRVKVDGSCARAFAPELSNVSGGRELAARGVRWRRLLRQRARHRRGSLTG